MLEQFHEYEERRTNRLQSWMSARITQPMIEKALPELFWETVFL